MFGSFQHGNDRETVYAWFTFSHWLIYANSAANPIIYNFLSGELVISFLFSWKHCEWIWRQCCWKDFLISVYFQGNSARSSRQPSLVVNAKDKVRRWGWGRAPTVENPCPPKSSTWTMCRAFQITWYSFCGQGFKLQLHRSRARLHLFLCLVASCLWLSHRHFIQRRALEIIPFKTLFAGLSEMCWQFSLLNVLLWSVVRAYVIVICILCTLCLIGFLWKEK